MRTGGWGKHNFLIGGAFRKAKYEIRRRKNRNRKARAGKNSFPPTPFLFARPSVRFLPRFARQSVGVSFKKGSSFVQQLRPNTQIITHSFSFSLLVTEAFLRYNSQIMNLSFKPQHIPLEEKPIQIILASQSIGRKMLLEKLGLPFRTIVSNVDEDAIKDVDPVKTIKRRALAKAEEIVKNPRVFNLPIDSRSLIIAADSMAILGKKTFGKTESREEAREMVKEIMGKTHTFVTAVKVLYLHGLTVKKMWDAVSKTKVSMRKMTSPELDQYISRYDFSRFAAAYTINEAPWDLVTKIDGSYTNVIGLPFEIILPIFRKLEIIK